MSITRTGHSITKEEEDYIVMDNQWSLLQLTLQSAPEQREKEGIQNSQTEAVKMREGPYPEPILNLMLWSCQFLRKSSSTQSPPFCILRGYFPKLYKSPSVTWNFEWFSLSSLFWWTYSQQIRRLSCVCAEAAEKSSKKGEITSIIWNCFTKEVGLEVTAEVIGKDRQMEPGFPEDWAGNCPCYSNSAQSQETDSEQVD